MAGLPWVGGIPRLPAMQRSLPILFLLASLAPLSPVRGAGEAPQVDLAPIYGSLKIERPVSVQIPADGTKRRFLVEQTGRIKILPADESGGEAAVFLDLTDRLGVEKDFEEGLL